jgi:hypothetical protein
VIGVVGRVRAIALLAAATLLVTLAACSEPTADGTLIVTISGLGEDVPADIVIARGGLSLTVKADGSFALAPGAYSVTIGPVARPSAMARTLFESPAPTQALTVPSGGTTTLEVAYERRRGTGRIWVSGATGVAGYGEGSWNQTGSPVPMLTLAPPPGEANAQDVLVSPAGDLWATYTGVGSVARYALQDLDTDGAQPVGWVGVDGAPTALAWHDGSLYVMSFTTGVVRRFDAADGLSGPSSVVADAVITVNTYSGPGASAALAFDGTGRM